MFLRVVHLSIIAISLVACAATGPQFERLELASENEAMVYVYRPNSFAAGGSYPMLSIDGKEVLALKNGGYLRRSVSPGPLTIELLKTFNWSHPLAIMLNAEPGRSYFLKLEIQHSGNIQTNPIGPGTVITHNFLYRFREVSESEALSDLKATNRLE